MKKMYRPRSGSLPSSRNRQVPITTVIASASSGDANAISRDGCGRTSSFSMVDLLLGAVPQAAHLDRRLGRRHARRDAALRDDDESVADLEQLVELLADDQQRAALVAQ